MTPEPRFEHLLRMTDKYGTYEHADHSAPRPGHGYCTDDMARVLVVTSREPCPNREVSDLAHQALRFIVDAQGASGDCRNRRDRRGQWQGPYSVEDAWGRSLWGSGTAAARDALQLEREVALGHFDRGARQRSRSPRSMAFAALGADEILAVYPGHRGALGLLADTVPVVGLGATNTSWPWPEPRLSYANAVLPDALIAAGDRLSRPDVLQLRPPPLGLAPRPRDGQRSPLGVPGRGPRPRRSTTGVRPAADRGRGPGRRVLSGRDRHWR